jgi:hypothetical protein
MLGVHDLQRPARCLVEVGKRTLVREEMHMHVDPLALSVCMEFVEKLEAGRRKEATLAGSGPACLRGGAG